MKNYDEPEAVMDGNTLVPEPLWVVDAPFQFFKG